LEDSCCDIVSLGAKNDGAVTRRRVRTTRFAHIFRFRSCAAAIILRPELGDLMSIGDVFYAIADMCPRHVYLYPNAAVDASWEHFDRLAAAFERIEELVKKAKVEPD
jgi:hypothetical protein